MPRETAAEVSAALARLARSDVTAAQLRAVVTRGMVLLTEVSRAAGEAGGDEGQRLQDDAARIGQQLVAAESAVEGWPDDQVIPPGSEAWRRSVGPVVAGLCWGSPWCSQEAIAAGGGPPLAIAPVGAQPWVLAGALSELRRAQREAWQGLLRDLGDRARATGGAIADLAKWAALGGGVWLAWKAFSE